MTSNKTSNPDIAEYKETQSSTVKRLMDYAHKETQIESVKIMLTDFALYDKKLIMKYRDQLEKYDDWYFKSHNKMTDFYPKTDKESYIEERNEIDKEIHDECYFTRNKLLDEWNSKIPLKSILDGLDFYRRIESLNRYINLKNKDKSLMSSFSDIGSISNSKLFIDRINTAVTKQKGVIIEDINKAFMELNQTKLYASNNSLYSFDTDLYASFKTEFQNRIKDIMQAHVDTIILGWPFNSNNYCVEGLISYLRWALLTDYAFPYSNHLELMVAVW
jgi:hypothetical protein